MMSKLSSPIYTNFVTTSLLCKAVSIGSQSPYFFNSSTTYLDLEESRRSLEAANAITRTLEEKAQGSDAELSALRTLRETVASLESGEIGLIFDANATLIVNM